jgi:Na+/H+ antiporter NhaC
MPKPARWALFLMALISIFLIREYTDIIRYNPATKDYGLWSIVPALLTLFLCFATREVIPALFLGVFAGGIIAGRYNIVKEYLIPAIGSPSYGQILLVYLWCLGGLIGLWTRTGGAWHFAEWVGKRIVKGRRTAKFFSYLLGVLFHQGGTISTILAGATAKPIADKNRVSHEELSYIIDSTASPVATILPFNVWPLYIGGLVAGTIPLFPDQATGVNFFFRAIPFNFYASFAILFTFLMSVEMLPWYGRKMKKAMERARETGKLDRDGANPLTSKELSTVSVPEGYPTGNDDFILPIGTLLAVAIIPKLLLGEMYISEAFLLAVLSAMILALYKGMRLGRVIEGFVDGCKGVTLGAIILGFAVTLGKVSTSLGTANFIVRTTSHIISPYFLPAIFLGICMFISFSVGTSWGTYAVVFPIAMPLAYAVNPDPFFITLCFAAVTGGATYGDQCSPISDTTILSSLATGSDLMDHVFTQLPLATLAAAIAGVIYTIIAFIYF